MELGGNAPFIVFEEDADLDVAVAGAMGGEDAQHGGGVYRRQPLSSFTATSPTSSPPGSPNTWAPWSSGPVRGPAWTSAR